MADTTENNSTADDAKMTSSGADFVATPEADHTTNVSGEVIDGVSGAGLITDRTTDTDTDASTTPDTDTATAPSAPSEPLPTAGEIKDQAVQKGQEALAQGKQAASQAIEQGKEVAGQAIGQAKEAAGQALDQAKGQIVTELDSRKDTLAQTLEGAVQALQSTSQQFRDQNVPYVGEYADTFASQLQKASDYLKGKDINELARDAERIARENPVAFVGGAFVLGIALARFLKSSTEGSPLAFVQNGASGGSASVTASQGERNADKRVTDTFGERPLTAHGYVAGVGSIGDN